MNGRNPLLPLEYCVPDAEAHVMSDGRVYLYGSLDKHRDSYCSGEYVVASSADMRNWTVSEKPSFTVDSVPWAKEGVSQKHSSLLNVKSFDDLPAHIKEQLPESARNYPIESIVDAIEQRASEGLPKEIRLYAPDTIEKDGKYYLYFCMSDDSEGVAVSDSPTGPFENAVRLPVSGIDPAVFVDDDGSAYYYWGQFSANGARLNPDMMTIDEGSIVEGLLTESQHHFHEGSSMRKRGDTYYYIFADTSRGRPTCLGYATSKSPLGPFTYRGVIIDNGDCDPKSWNNHGSIEKVNGRWYVFYHRSSGSSQFQRRVCCEPIYFDENGLIKEVKMTSTGVGEPFKPGEYIPASAACSFTGWSYLSGDSVKLKPEGSAIYRYVSSDEKPAELRLIGAGDEKTIRLSLTEADVGLYEITLTNGGNEVYDLTGFLLL